MTFMFGKNNVRRFAIHFRTFIRLPAERYFKWLRARGTFVIRHSSVTLAHSTTGTDVLPLARYRVCGRCVRLIGCERAFVGWLARAAPRYCRLFNFACFLGRPLCFERFNLNRTQTVGRSFVCSLVSDRAVSPVGED